MDAQPLSRRAFAFVSRPLCGSVSALSARLRDMFMIGEPGLKIKATKRKHGMSDDDMKAELERLRRENEALKKGRSEASA